MCTLLSSEYGWFLHAAIKQMDGSYFERKFVRKPKLFDSRFLVMPERSVPNLASKVLRLTQERLATDEIRLSNLKTAPGRSAISKLSEAPSPKPKLLWLRRLRKGRSQTFSNQPHEGRIP
jgi:hypothetical protein